MLKNIDLSRKVPKEEYKSIKDQLELKLAELQRKAKEMNIPVIVVFEGWDAAGKGTLINDLILPLDPRGFTVYSTHSPNEEEAMRPFLWRFWNHTPERGRITIYDRSWYRRVLFERVAGNVKKKDLPDTFNDIRSFERQLADDGNIIIKFFLHISCKEQKKRFKKLRKNRATSWRVTKEDLKRQRQYDKYLAVTEEMLAETDSDFAPWTIIEAHDQRFASLKIFKTVIAALEKSIRHMQRKTGTRKKTTTKNAGIELPENMNPSILDSVDLSLSYEQDEYRSKLKKLQKQIRQLEHEIYEHRIPIVIVYQGWDAAGKGGNIRRLTETMDPRGYEVIPIAAPNDIERAHHYLWRFWTKIPKAGHISIFDRSWYGRVLVERVEGFCSETEWKRAYREINEMEKHLTNFGTILLKFWLHIDKDEQLARFKARQNEKHKQWKITEEDWRNREKWDEYQTAVEEMLFRTSTPYAPWTIVESNCKWYARVKVLNTVVKAIEARI
jgi:polyphosphate:AMP phosphotransferase